MFTTNDVVNTLNSMSPTSRESLRVYFNSGCLEHIHMNIIRSWKTRDIMKNNGHLSVLGLACARAITDTGDGPEALKDLFGGYRA